MTNKLIINKQKFSVESHNNKTIGVFDSGVGGLTIAKAIATILPHKNLAYFGDTANAPWGDKTISQIKYFSQKICEFLLNEHEIEIIVIACNSSSAITLDNLINTIHNFDKNIKVVNVIDPVVNYVVSKLDNCEIGLIGTTQTINSQYIANKIQNQNPSLKVHSLATPKLVPIIENGLIDKATTKEIIYEYLSESAFENIQALILGCTHYPLIKHIIEDYYVAKHNNKNKKIKNEVGGEIEIIDSTLFCAEAVKNILNELDIKDIENKKNKKDAQNVHKFSKKILYTSSENSYFKKVAKQSFQNNVTLKVKNLWVYNGVTHLESIS